MHPDFTTCHNIEALEGRFLMASNAYIQQDLVSDGPLVPAAHTDSHLLNAWGLTTFSSGIQIAAADSRFTVGYDASGTAVGPDVAVLGRPTGIVFNDDSSLFKVTTPAGNGSAKFIYDTEQGKIAAWSTVNNNRKVVTVVDHTSVGASYKGAALAKFKTGTFLYVANFALGKI